MLFGQRVSIRKNLTPVEFAKGLWNPSMKQYRDLIEDHLYISRKRRTNKLCMFKLQLNIFQELLINYETINAYKKLEKSIKEPSQLIIPENDVDYQLQNIKSELFSNDIINRALKEISDGFVWRYFDYNRAILNILADKEPIDSIRRDKGTINNLYEFAEVFTKDSSTAIYNDITNFLRVGDVTEINNDGTIDFIEVKSGKTRGRRISRQKQRMEELIEFFNTGLSNYDGRQFKIVESNIKQKYYLGILHDTIMKAKHRGYDTALIGNHIILEIVDGSKMIKSKDFMSYFESRHKSIRELWNKNNDFIDFSLIMEKMEYSKNCAPFSIFPFSDEICADIIAGKILIGIHFNYSEILRIIKKSGWTIVDSIISKTEDELMKLRGLESKDITFLQIKKGGFLINVPPGFIARLKFELLAPSVLIEYLDSMYLMRHDNLHDAYLYNFVDDRKTWN